MNTEKGIMQELQENTIIPLLVTKIPQGVVESDGIPVGTVCTGRTGMAAEKGIDSGTERRSPRKQTVRSRKTRRGRKRNPRGRATKGPNAGQHIRPGILEAAEILIAEGYTVGKVVNPGSPFELVGHRIGEMIWVSVVRPRQDVTNAAQVMETYRGKIQEIGAYWRSGADNFQFWVFSRERGLFRYKVFNGGIWNVETMQKFKQKKPAENPIHETGRIADDIRRTRNAPCPANQTVTVAAPVSIPSHAGIPQ